MAHLGTIDGRATITAGGDDLGEVDYSISVFMRRNLKQASGYITGTEAILFAASQAHGAVLTLEDGETVNITVTRFTMPGDRAQIKVSGPVPGF